MGIRVYEGFCACVSSQSKCHEKRKADCCGKTLLASYQVDAYAQGDFVAEIYAPSAAFFSMKLLAFVFVKPFKTPLSLRFFVRDREVPPDIYLRIQHLRI